MNQQELIADTLQIEQQLGESMIEDELLDKLNIPMPCEDSIHLIVNEDATITIYIDHLHLTDFVANLYLVLVSELGEGDVLPVSKEESRGRSYYQITLLNDAPTHILEIIQHGRKDRRSESPFGLPTIQEETESELATFRKM